MGKTLLKSKNLKHYLLLLLVNISWGFMLKNVVGGCGHINKVRL